jgi:hypothetical protein
MSQPAQTSSDINPFESVAFPAPAEDDIVEDLGSTTTIKESVSITDEDGETETISEEATVDGFPQMPSIEEDWQHDVIEYNGIKLGVRLPNQQALTGFTMSTGGLLPEMMRQNMASMFVHKHFSPQSYLYMMAKMMDPDDEVFTEDSFNEILELMMTQAGEKIVETIKAKQAAVDSSKTPIKRLKPRKRT